jgi:hypothetical protein
MNKYEQLPLRYTTVQNNMEVCHSIFMSEWYIYRDCWYGRVYSPNPEPLMISILAIEQSILLHSLQFFLH